MPITIRRATGADCDPVADLWQELYEYHLALDPRERLSPDAREHYRVRFAGLLEQEHCCVFVADEDGIPVGYISGALRELPPVFEERFQGYIEDAIVTARCRRRGIGAQLFRALEEWFRERGVHLVGVSVAAANPLSHDFWRSRGLQDYRISLRGELK